MLRTERRILVATDVQADAALVAGLLREEFDHIASSTDPQRAVEDFEKHRPAVLILAFDELAKAERYYLGLYRTSSAIHAVAHRTLILCATGELRQVYELCRKETFDDYVPFWPMAHDPLRLRMAVHHALRRIAADATPGTRELAGEARRLSGLDARLEEFVGQGQRHATAASRSLQQAQRGIGDALERFCRAPIDEDHQDPAEIGDRAGLRTRIERLKAEGIDKYCEAAAAAVQPLSEWAGGAAGFAPQLEALRALQTMAGRIRPLILVVEDDEFQRKLLSRMLAEFDPALIFAGTGAEALAMLRGHRPDVILMDIDLPGGIGGVQITRRIKSAEPFAAIPVIMITGHSSEEAVRESLKAGAADFVVKPFDRDALTAKLRSVLGGGDRAPPGTKGAG